MVKPYFILFSLRSTLLIIDLREFGSYSPPSFLRTVNTKFASNGSSSVYGFTILGEGAKNNDVFNLTRDAISAKKKVLKKQGKGNKPKKSQPLTDDEIKIC
jgi:hypothetical protein